MKWELYFDGCISGNVVGWGFILISPEGEEFDGGGKRDLEDMATNNIAEYLGLISGLQEALRKGIEELTVKGDSQLVIYQMTGRYQVKKSHLVPLNSLAKQLSQKFKNISFEWVPREENSRADKICSGNLR